jgi:hypothetical protein
LGLLSDHAGPQKEPENPQFGINAVKASLLLNFGFFLKKYPIKDDSMQLSVYKRVAMGQKY